MNMDKIPIPFRSRGKKAKKICTKWRGNEQLEEKLLKIIDNYKANGSKVFQYQYPHRITVMIPFKVLKKELELECCQSSARTAMIKFLIGQNINLYKICGGNFYFNIETDKEKTNDIEKNKTDKEKGTNDIEKIKYEIENIENKLKNIISKSHIPKSDLCRLINLRSILSKRIGDDQSLFIDDDFVEYYSGCHISNYENIKNGFELLFK